MEPDTKLALKAELSSITKQKIKNRCQDMESRLKTHRGGLPKVNHGNLNSHTTTVSPDMIISYLQQTVRDYLERWENIERLVEVSEGQNKYTLNLFHEIFKAHILIFKGVLDATKIIERRPWDLIQEGLTWALRDEQYTQTSDPELIDGFFNVVSKQWNYTQDKKRPFFGRHKSMLTLATQRGLYHYLEGKLSLKNAMHTGDFPRSLLDYALCSYNGMVRLETFVSIDRGCIHLTQTR